MSDARTVWRFKASEYTAGEGTDRANADGPAARRRSSRTIPAAIAAVCRLGYNQIAFNLHANRAGRPQACRLPARIDPEWHEGDTHRE